MPRVLVVGGGGREHALCLALARSSRLEALYCAPGNAGISRLARCVPIQVHDVEQLASFVATERIDLTVIGSELPLALGLVDTLTAAGYRAIGPTKAAARIETSKAFGKEVMNRAGVPTARAAIFTTVTEATAYVTAHGAPIVIKADGLAGGKGVTVARTTPEAVEAVEALMGKRVVGDAGRTIVIEEYLAGEEVTVMALTDGETILPLEPAQDAKRLLDGDRGPNTGGMGAHSPVAWLSPSQREMVLRDVLRPVVKTMAELGTPYRGILYAGLMMVKGRPYVLEFNARFGDPEAQAVLPRLETDLLGLLDAIADGRLGERTVRWRAEAAVCVVLASKGYPGAPGVVDTGQVIHGLAEAEREADTFVFHAGTAERAGPGPQAGAVVTAGGRVLGVTALGPDLAAARSRAYQAVGRIRFEGMQYRRDIAGLALPRPDPAG